MELRDINVSNTNFDKGKFWFWIKKLNITTGTVMEGQFSPEDIDKYKAFTSVQYDAPLTYNNSQQEE